MRSYVLIALVMICLMAVMALIIPFIVAVKLLLFSAIECWLHNYRYALVFAVMSDFFTLNKTLRLVAAGAWCGFLISLPICWKMWRSITRYDPLDKYFK